MRRTVTLSLLLALAPALTFAGPVESPILGGTPATLGQFPSVVLIELNGGLCSGTLIARDWVLTAAHCVTPQIVGLPSQAAVTAAVRVHYNTVNANTTPGTVLQATETIPNPMFNVNNLGQYDVGLIKLATPVTDVKFVPVNLEAAKAPVGIHVTMVGFGQTSSNMFGVEYVVEQTSVACATTGAGEDANLLCFNQIGGKGKCHGDSGGPSFATVDGRQVQVGITSFGDGNCQQFGADTRTDAERTFLLKYVPELECSTDADCPMGRECFQHKCIAAPFGPGGVGTACTMNSDCDSTMCAMTGTESYCSMQCTVGDPLSCPAGLECIATGATGACWPVPKDDSGCCDSSGAGAPTALFSIAFIGLVWRRRRR